MRSLESANLIYMCFASVQSFITVFLEVFVVLLKGIHSKCIWGKNDVYILGITSSRFIVGAGLPQAYALLRLLFVIFVDRIQPVQLRLGELPSL